MYIYQWNVDYEEMEIAGLYFSLAFEQKIEGPPALQAIPDTTSPTPHHS